MSAQRFHKVGEGLILSLTVAFCSTHRELPPLVSGALLVLLLGANLFTYFLTLPDTWVAASRTNDGLGKGLQYGILLLPLGLAALQMHHGHAARADTSAESDGYIRFMFWCSCACSFITLLDATLLGNLIKPLPIRMGFVQALAFGVYALWTGKPHFLPDEGDEDKELEFVFYLMYTFGTLLCYDLLFFAWRKVFVKSFTVGEAVLVIQSLTLTTVDFVAYAAVRKAQVFPNMELFPEREPLSLFLQGECCLSREVCRYGCLGR